MNVYATIVATLVFIGPLSVCAQVQAAGREPVAWGALSVHRSCLIFSEGQKTTRRFYGFGETSKTFEELTLLEAHGHPFDKKVFPENTENLDALMRLAHNDAVMFVKIPAQYTPELLEKAHAACGSDMQLREQ